MENGCDLGRNVLVDSLTISSDRRVRTFLSKKPLMEGPGVGNGPPVSSDPPSAEFQTISFINGITGGET